MVFGGIVKRCFTLSIALVIGVGAILPLLTLPVSAANIYDVTPTDEAKSASYYRTLRTCINNEMNTTIQLTGSDNGAANPTKWFSDNNAYGYIFPEGKTDCKDIASKALSLWGWGTDYGAFLKVLGFTYNASDAKWSVANRDNLRNKFDSAVQAKYYGISFAGEPTQSGAARYEMFLNVFNKACNAKDLGPVSSVTNSSYKAWLNDSTADRGTQVSEDTANISGTKDGSYVYFSKVDVIEQVNGQSVKVPHGYAYQASSAVANAGWNGANATTNGDVRIYGYHNSAVERSCHQIQKGITENTSAWLAWAREQPVPVVPPASTGGTTPSSDPDPTASSCAIEGIGWIVCPVINFLAVIADQSFNFLADGFLKTDPKVFNTDDGTYKAWAVMRNIANILFVIAFLFIVFSQLTGFGISNYGVKKMLPRIVVAAILVNVSYFISQLAIDVSNILGYSIRDVFSSIVAQIDTAAGGTSPGEMSVLAAGDGGFVSIAGGILGAGLAVGAVYLLLSAFGPILLAAVLALIVILFILIARQAIVILLVILSPIAFVAFLLPNTESLFKQWRKILTAMLMLFPIIALVYGASSLASVLLGKSFSGIGGTDSAMFGQIISAGILVLPLFAVPVLLKKSLDSVPAVGKFANKWASRATGNVGSKLKESNRGSVIGRGSAIRKQARDNYRSKRFAEKITGGGLMGTLNRGAAGGIPIPFDKAGAASRESLQKVATAATYKAQMEEISDAEKLIETENLDGNERQILAMTGSVRTKKGKVIDGEVNQRAAIKMQLGGAGSMGNIHEIVEASNDTLKNFTTTIGEGAISSAAKDPALSGANIDAIKQGSFTYDSAMGVAFEGQKYTAESFSQMHEKARARVVEYAQKAEANGDSSKMEMLRGALRGIQASPQLMGKVSSVQMESLVKDLGVAGGGTPPPAAAGGGSSPGGSPASGGTSTTGSSASSSPTSGASGATYTTSSGPSPTTTLNSDQPAEVRVDPASTAADGGLYRINSAGKPIRPKNSSKKSDGAPIGAQQAAVIDANAGLIHSMAGAQAAAAAAQAASLNRGETFDQAKAAADEAYRKNSGA